MESALPKPTDAPRRAAVACYSRALRSPLLAWFGRHQRDLPWRRTKDPYRIWLSEIMLQQTRVAAAVPYYEKFLARFPSVEALAAAPEADVLTHWAGLGYYSRARNLHKAARQMAASGQGFPHTYDAIRALPGVGDYTAAAVASIAFGLPHAAVDGNVLRVTARLACEPGDIQAKSTRDRLTAAAQALLDTRHPGDWNQAMMELGATVCLPREPLCLHCPFHNDCAARQQNRQRELPVKIRVSRQVEIEKTLLIIEKGDSILLWQRPADSGRMAGFWELPEPDQLPEAVEGETIGVFRHTITTTNFTFRAVRAQLRRAPKGFRWMKRSGLISTPVSTVLRKALAFA
ncbi:MAG: A/G-specific adenine glycosylase [Bryobacterales bacterium]|nr:A/G-specific adenine glycosylase [Bryobacterales bacterium]